MNFEEMLKELLGTTEGVLHLLLFFGKIVLIFVIVAAFGIPLPIAILGMIILLAIGSK